MNPPPMKHPLGSSISQVLTAWPRRRASCEHNRLSFSSLSSHDSGSAGGRSKGAKHSFKKLKERRAIISHSLSLIDAHDLRHSGKKRQGEENCAGELARNNSMNNRTFLSLPVAGRSQRRPSAQVMRRAMDGSSNHNEEWEDTAASSNDIMKQQQDASYKKLFLPDLMKKKRKPKKSSMKQRASRTTRADFKKRRAVTFTEATKSIPYHTDPSHERTKWYKQAEHDEFLNDAVARAGVTRRSMTYASTNDNSYNRSTGLVSAEALKEYLSTPEVIIGMEHLLNGQSMARLNLRRYHTKALLEEQDRQKKQGLKGGCNMDLLADKLRNNSTISAHMARERAAYTLLLD